MARWSDRWFKPAVEAAIGALVAVVIVVGFVLAFDRTTRSATADDEDDVVRRKLNLKGQRPRSAKVDDRSAFAPRPTATFAEPKPVEHNSPTKPEPAPGKLSVNCIPACDSIVAGGRSLGPSPVFSFPMDPGVHRVTLKGNGKTKTIMVEIISGQITTQTMSMK